MEEQKPIKLKFAFEPHLAARLKTMGVEGQLFSGQRNAFDVVDAAVRMRPNVRNMRTSTMGANRQLNGLRKMLEEPFRGSKTLAIGSFPSDFRAKLVALNVLLSAAEHKDEKARAHQQPVWHRVYGGYRDKLLDDPHCSPCFIVITNIDVASTPQKVEKVRDILTKFDTIPKVVVVSGCDPIWFFANRLHLPLDRALYLGQEDRVPDADLLDL
jgi:hypothetical protein